MTVPPDSDLYLGAGIPSELVLSSLVYFTLRIKAPLSLLVRTTEHV